MKKLERLREIMNQRGLDSILVYNEFNQRYLSNFAFTDGYLLITLNAAYLVTDMRYYEDADKVATDYIVVAPKKETDFLKEMISSHSLKRLGVEGNFISYARYRALSEKYKDLDLVDIESAIEMMRRTKTPEEIEKIQRVGRRSFSEI